MTHKQLRRLFQVLLGVALGLAIAFPWLRGPGATAPVVGSEGYFLPSPLPAPPFSLTSHLGVPVSSGDFPGKILVVFFGYTSCPDVCPLTLSRLTRAFGAMDERGDRVQVLLVTVDPERDTPERLEGYLSSFHPSFVGLTGTKEEIRLVADGFGAYFSEAREGESYTVDHTSRIFVVDRFGRIPLTFPVTATPEEISRDLVTLVEISGG